MFCQKCGSESIEGSAFCQKCGEKLITDVTASQAPAAQSVSKKKKSKKLVLGIAGCAIILVIIIAVVSSGGNDRYVRMVKGGTLNAYPQMTVGTAFDNFMRNAKWKSIKAEDGKTYVNVSGIILYLEKEVEAVVQFFVDAENGSFEYYACEFNGIPQNNFIFWALIEKIYEGQSGTPAMSQSYNQSMRLESNDADAYINRGLEYAQNGDFDRAIAEFDQAIRLDPNSAEAYNSRSWAYDITGEYDLAIADSSQAIRLDPNFADAYYNRGTAYLNKYDDDRAIADYTQAIRLDPNFADAYNDRGHAYLEKGDYDRAIADFTQAIRLVPNNTHLSGPYYYRGDAYINKGDYDRAIADYSEAIRLFPMYDFHYDRGNAYLYIGDYDRAIADFEAALSLAFDDIEIRRALEEARRQSGASSQQEEGVYVLFNPSRLRTSVGNVYRAPIELTQKELVGYINIQNPQRLGPVTSRIRIVTGRNFFGQYQSYDIDEDGRPGGTVYTVVDAVVID